MFSMDAEPPKVAGLFFERVKILLALCCCAAFYGGLSVSLVLFKPPFPIGVVPLLPYLALPLALVLVLEAGPIVRRISATWSGTVALFAFVLSSVGLAALMGMAAYDIASREWAGAWPVVWWLFGLAVDLFYFALSVTLFGRGFGLFIAMCPVDESGAAELEVLAASSVEVRSYLNGVIALGRAPVWGELDMLRAAASR